METLWIWGVLRSIYTLSFSQECHPQLLENIDFPGTDIKFVYSPDANHCQQLCTQDPACLYFTFVRADWTEDDRHFYCYLKSSPSGQPNKRTPLQGVTSGFSLKPCSPDPEPCLPQLYHNIDFTGADYRTLFTADYEECQRVCTQDPTCQFFTFVNAAFTSEKIRYKCNLKFSWAVPIIPNIQTKFDAVSGFSQRAQTTKGSKPVCEGKLFPSTDIPGNDILVVRAASPEHCQALCSAHSSCTYFTFVSENFDCHLKDNQNVMVLKSIQGSTSGLPARFCQLDNSWARIPFEDRDFPLNDIRFELLDDADSCEKACTDDPNCQFYTYCVTDTPDTMNGRRCYLKRAITMPAPPKVTKLANVVSGFQLRNCVHRSVPLTHRLLGWS
ncbi:coagulation factor XI-like [Clinocottus analis]|uniref:coagulation factor XI-like n=1 Tax=Clinocottus analis TaxID=304258 RepID=UPI0035C2085F